MGILGVTSTKRERLGPSRSTTVSFLLSPPSSLSSLVVVNEMKMNRRRVSPCHQQSRIFSLASIMGYSLLLLLSCPFSPSRSSAVIGVADASSPSLNLNAISVGLRSANSRLPLPLPLGIPRPKSHTATNSHIHIPPKSTSTPRGGATSTPLPNPRVLLFWENMICGAVSRSIAQTITHPANTMKTILQSSRKTPGVEPMTIRKLARTENLRMLTRGAGAQFVLSVPHGAINFAVLEGVRDRLNALAEGSAWARQKERETAYFGPALDFLSSAIATCCCSVVSTPQMMILDNIMAGTYPTLAKAVGGLSKDVGVKGFYAGWWPGLAGKIPSYALTWTLFQQLKRVHLHLFDDRPTDLQNAAMGCLASTTSVCVMIPMDTIKTRLVTQIHYPHLVPYKGIVDAAVRITREEGIGAFYRGLPPRLFSVVPMIGIQFGVYEFMKKTVIQRDVDVGWLKFGRSDGGADDGGADDERQSQNILRRWRRNRFQGVMMEVAADDDQPFPAPNLRVYDRKGNR